MIVIHDLTHSITDSCSVATIGVFDGVHLGHQALICQLVTQAQVLRCQAALITFHPHPAEVLSGSVFPRYMTTPSEKAVILEKLGIDLLAILAFTRQMANTSAVDFLTQVCHVLHVREIWVGPQFALGHDRQGNIPALRELGRTLGFNLQVMEPLRCGPGDNGGELVTSSRIRRLVLAGKMREAAQLLGRFYSVMDEVAHGDHRGRTLGFPTANLEVPEDRIMPPDGVYAGYGWVGEKRHEAVMSLGVRPTFGDHERLLEVYLLDFDVDLYGTDLRVEFVARLRPEMKFDSAQTLIAQMYQDKAQAREILAAEGKAH